MDDHSVHTGSGLDVELSRAIAAHLLSRKKAVVGLGLDDQPTHVRRVVGHSVLGSDGLKDALHLDGFILHLNSASLTRVGTNRAELALADSSTIDDDARWQRSRFLQEVAQGSFEVQIDGRDARETRLLHPIPSSRCHHITDRVSELNPQYLPVDIRHTPTMVGSLGGTPSILSAKDCGGA